MRKRRKWLFDCAFDDRVVGGRKGKTVISFRPTIEGRIKSPDVDALTNTSASPIVIGIENDKVVFSKTVASFHGVLHYRGFVFAIVEFGCGGMLFESLAALPASFADVCRFCFTRLTVGTSAW